MSDHRLSEPMRSTPVRAALVLGALVAVVGLSVGVADAAQPAAVAAKVAAKQAAKTGGNGFLILTAADVDTFLAPGKAVKAALVACDLNDETPVAVTVQDVREAFPEPFEVCPSVTLTSQVAADEDEVAEA